MRRPEWIKDAPELVECLLRVRDNGVWGLRRNREPIAALEDASRAICSVEIHGDQYSLIKTTLEQAIPQMSRTDYQEAARALFGLTSGTQADSSRTRRLRAATIMNQSISRFRDSNVGFERAILVSVANSIQRLAIDKSVPESGNALDKFKDVGITPDEVLVARSLLHVARTLEVRKLYAGAAASTEIDGLLQRYVRWYSATETESAGALLLSFDALCSRYVGTSVFDLLGDLELDSPAPDRSPDQRLPILNYPSPVALHYVPGGREPLTGDIVTPFYIACFPVTVSEWHQFLSRFGWKPSDTWLQVYGSNSAEELSNGETSKLPAIGMSYWASLAYCFWLWLTTPYRFRLPTEAEWNFAANGGDNRRYPWGDSASESDIRRHAVINSPLMLPVDLKEPSGPQKVVGLSGNIWEYVSTLWLGDTPQQGSDIEIPDLLFAMLRREWWETDERLTLNETAWLEQVKIVMKGGSWGLGLEYAEVKSRIYSSIYNHGAYGGFRLAVTAAVDPSTGHAAPQPSPFLSRNLNRVRKVTTKDMHYMAVDWLEDEAERNAPPASYCGAGMADLVREARQPGRP